MMDFIEGLAYTILIFFWFIHDHMGTIIRIVCFCIFIYLGEFFAPFAHWLTHGSLPPWMEQLAKMTPGIAVAIWHVLAKYKKLKK